MGQCQDPLSLPHKIYLNQTGIRTQHFILFLKICLLADSTELVCRTEKLDDGDDLAALPLANLNVAFADWVGEDFEKERLSDSRTAIPFTGAAWPIRGVVELGDINIGDPLPPRIRSGLQENTLLNSRNEVPG